METGSVHLRSLLERQHELLGIEGRPRVIFITHHVIVVFSNSWYHTYLVKITRYLPSTEDLPEHDTVGSQRYGPRGELGPRRMSTRLQGGPFPCVVLVLDASQYPGYPSNYWYPQSHSTPHYANTYPSGTEIQQPYNPQPVPGVYPNGVYNPGQGHYSTSNFHPSNPFYCADQMPQRPAPGPYPNQGCPPEQTAAGHLDILRAHILIITKVPTQCPKTLLTLQARLCTPDPRLRAGDTPVDMGPHRSNGRLHSSQASSLGSSSIHKTTMAIRSVPNILQHGQGLERDQQHQNPPQVGPKPQPPPNAPNPANGKPAEFSSPPQLYNRTGRGGPMEPNSSQGQPPPSVPSPAPPPPAAPQTYGPIGPQPANDSPGLTRVHQIMVRVLLLQEDVDEFVGKKTDKTYRYLEELLTKELLALDSVETQGQEAVRQARREAVQRIQGILDRLEKKAF
ncbi:BAG family molecular chaperone regulator 4 [Merluccius polli]|uniref:BAG family molecular chaperone regulator 4 n=1 Tax=Merluccius polli TaxID=89951 RepID=A0AA47NT56_MERPO|nr:BAG family molecular chaperone regulator 4 [Merluccius polli]